MREHNACVYCESVVSLQSCSCKPESRSEPLLLSSFFLIQTVILGKQRWHLESITNAWPPRRVLVSMQPHTVPAVGRHQLALAFRLFSLHAGTSSCIWSHCHLATWSRIFDLASKQVGFFHLSLSSFSLREFPPSWVIIVFQSEQDMYSWRPFPF